MGNKLKEIVYRALYRWITPLTWIGLLGFCVFAWYHLITIVF